MGILKISTIAGLGNSNTKVETKNNTYIFNCIGGGRCFKKDDKFTHNVDLEKYLAYETN